MKIKSVEALSERLVRVIVSGASHLFEEPGTLDKVASLAGRWFRDHLASVRDHLASEGASS